MDSKRLINHPDFKTRKDSLLYEWIHYTPWTIHPLDQDLSDKLTMECFMCFSARAISDEYYGSKHNGLFWEKFS